MKSAYALCWLEQVITSEAWTKTAQNGLPSCLSLPSLNEALARRTASIKSLMMHQVFSMKDERMLEALVQQYQAALIRLLDRLHEARCKEVQLSPEARTIQSVLSATLQELLQFLASYFSKYLDMDERVPGAYCTRVQMQWQEQLTNELQREKSTTQHPLSVLLIPVLQEATHTSKLNYRQMVYTAELFKAFARRHEAKQGADLFSPAVENLIYLNFNQPRFIAYVISEIEKAAAQSETATDYLHICLERVNSIRQKPGAAFRDQLPSVHHSIKEWIEFQIKPTPIVMTHADTTNNASNKVKISVSVAMLGLFVRLLYEEGIITTKNQAEVIRFFAQHFETPRQTDISSDSLYGSYFKPNPGTTRMMQECLMRMKNTLDKKF